MEENSNSCPLRRALEIIDKGQRTTNKIKEVIREEIQKVEQRQEEGMVLRLSDRTETHLEEIEDSLLRLLDIEIDESISGVYRKMHHDVAYLQAKTYDLLQDWINFVRNLEDWEKYKHFC